MAVRWPSTFLGTHQPPLAACRAASHDLHFGQVHHYSLRIMRPLLSVVMALAAALLPPPFIHRSGLYFGLRTQEPAPILTGLAWMHAHATHRGELRHGCWTHHKLQRWGWEANDAAGYGREFLGDAYNGVNLTIEFVDDLATTAGCRSWKARISGVPSEAGRAPSFVSLYSYIAMEGDGTAGGEAQVSISHLGGSDAVGTAVLLQASRRGGKDAVLMLLEEAPDNEHYHTARTHEGAGELPSDDTPAITSPELALPHYLGLRLPPGEAWRLDDVLEEALPASWRAAAALRDDALQSILDGTGRDARADFAQPLVPLLNNSIGEGANVLIVQHVVAAHAPFELEWSFLDEACAAAFNAGRVGGGREDDDDDDDDEESDVDGRISSTDDLADTAAAAAAAAAADWDDAFERLNVGMRHGAVAAAAASRRLRFEASMCARLRLCEGSTDGPALHVASAALGNLLGSITYFHGHQLVATPGWYAPTPDVELFTGVPSRSFFPRGFLWDEGFHQLVASQVAPALSRRVVASWYATQDEGGFIAREVILGTEAQGRVHSDFWVQFRDHANPPTFFVTALVMAVDGMCGGAAPPHVASARVGPDGTSSEGEGEAGRVAAFCARHVASATSGCTHACRAPLPRAHASGINNGSGSGSTTAVTGDEEIGEEDGDSAATLVFIKELYPKLTRHLAWFRATQAGGRPHTFRWRGSRPGGHKLVWHHFASGLDDYPRGLAAHEGDEHVDLLSWMAQCALVLVELGGLVGDTEGVAEYSRLATVWTAALDSHWNEGEGAFCDYGVAGYQDGVPVLGPVCHLGYVALYPLLFRLLPPADPRLPRLLDWMSSPNHTWSPYGLRGLSQSDPLYGVEESFEEDYWRSSVWVNMNYLAVAALRHYAGVGGPHAARCAELAAALEAAVVGGVVGEYSRTGFLWEHYSSIDGHGRGTHPFTGWTALVALMIAGRYPV